MPGGGAQIDTNAASAHNYGLDGDLDFAATDHLTFSASASYLKAYYVSYPDAEGFTVLGQGDTARQRGRQGAAVFAAVLRLPGAAITTCRHPWVSSRAR